jgi:signal transduction histidine kinase/CheY-like chemotaxis protein
LLFSSQLYAQPIAQRGVIDLRNTDFSTSPTIELNGEWQFFWNELIQPDANVRRLPSFVEVPHLWNDYPSLGSKGYGTYKLRILLPESHPKLSINMPDVYTAYSLYVNEEYVDRNGRVGVNDQNHRPNWTPKTIYLGTFEETNVIELKILVSNFSHRKGGLRVPIEIGDDYEIKRKREFELGYSYLLSGSLLMGGLFFLGLFFFGRSEKAIFYFALFCLVYSYRILGTDLYPLHFIFPGLSWELSIRLEYISLCLASAFFGVFVKFLFPEEIIKEIINGFTIAFFLFIVSVILLPATIFTSFLNYFFVVLGLLVVYSMFIFTRAAINKRVGSIFSLFSVLLVVLNIGWDLLEYFVIVRENLIVSYTGYISFFFLQSLTLSNQFSYRFNLAKQKAELASTAKTHFLSTMGHELRTPLNAVIGLSELLLDSKSEKEKTQFATTIKKSGENLLGIINNILDFTKIDSDEVEFEYEPTHIPSLIADTIKMLGSLTDPKKVNLSFRFDDALSDYLVVDQSRLQQIIINLVGNAIKFTESGEISVQVTTTESISEKGQILFIVKDTGIGIPENKMNLLFDRFSQIEADRSRKYQGTGLGLAISKRLIESMGGRIWVQSKESVGTTFYFTLPAESANPEEVKKLLDSSNKSDEALPDIQILVVEDNMINQKVVIKVLERLGYSAAIADNGFEAIDTVKEHDFDLIFMDMEMPEMDGIEATKHILKIPYQKKIPIIVAMTANATTEDKAKCFEAGMKDFIAKPITLQSTQDVLIKWFSAK